MPGIFTTCKTVIYINLYDSSILIFNSHRRESTKLLRYKDQSRDTVHGNNHCSLQHINTPCGWSAELFTVYQQVALCSKGQGKSEVRYILQLSSKDRTNGPPPATRMQLMVKRPPDGPQISPPTLGSAISHKHRQHHKLPQTHLPSTPRRRPRKINLTILFMYTTNITVKLIVKLCKYPVVYLDGKTRVENNKSKFKKNCNSASPYVYMTWCSVKQREGELYLLQAQLACIWNIFRVGIFDRRKQLGVRGSGRKDRSSVREFARCSIYTVNCQCQ